MFAPEAPYLNSTIAIHQPLRALSLPLLALPMVPCRIPCLDQPYPCSLSSSRTIAEHRNYMQVAPMIDYRTRYNGSLIRHLSRVLIL